MLLERLQPEMPEGGGVFRAEETDHLTGIVAHAPLRAVFALLRTPRCLEPGAPTSVC
jgi:hypothetical protein